MAKSQEVEYAGDLRKKNERSDGSDFFGIFLEELLKHSMDIKNALDSTDPHISELAAVRILHILFDHYDDRLATWLDITHGEEPEKATVLQQYVADLHAWIRPHNRKKAATVLAPLQRIIQSIADHKEAWQTIQFLGEKNRFVHKGNFERYHSAKKHWDSKVAKCWRATAQKCQKMLERMALHRK